MTVYEYKVTPAPRQVKKVKGLRGAGEMFAHTLAEAINHAAREGWDYVRAETLPAEGPSGWFRRGTRSEETVLIFRRARGESLEPRLAAPRAEEAPSPRLGMVDRPVPAGPRREARFCEEEPTPLRPGPRLGPAEG